MIREYTFDSNVFSGSYIPCRSRRYNTRSGTRKSYISTAKAAMNLCKTGNRYKDAQMESVSISQQSHVQFDAIFSMNTRSSDKRKTH